MDKEMFLQACEDYLILQNKYPEKFANLFLSEDQHTCVKISDRYHLFGMGWYRKMYVTTDNKTTEVAIPYRKHISVKEARQTKEIQDIIVPQWETHFPDIVRHFEKRHLYLSYSERTKKHFTDALARLDPVAIKGLDFTYELDKRSPEEQAFYDLITTRDTVSKAKVYLEKRKEFLQQELQYPWVDRKFDIRMCDVNTVLMKMNSTTYWLATRDASVAIRMKRCVFNHRYLGGDVFDDIFDDLADRYLLELTDDDNSKTTCDPADDATVKDDK